jgi:hypothetical protein
MHQQERWKLVPYFLASPLIHNAKEMPVIPVETGIYAKHHTLLVNSRSTPARGQAVRQNYAQFLRLMNNAGWG